MEGFSLHATFNACSVPSVRLSNDFLGILAQFHTVKFDEKYFTFALISLITINICSEVRALTVLNKISFSLNFRCVLLVIYDSGQVSLEHLLI